MKAYAVLCSVLLVAAAPVSASESETELRQAVSKIAASIADYYSKKDAAGIASHFARGGVFVNAAGQHDVAKYYEQSFKAGFDRNDIIVDDVWSLNPDTAIVIGQFKLTGKNPNSGNALEVSGRWTAVDVRENGQWKIRMLTSAPKPSN
ncbi:MAG: DUF4440 domain-containing protein [Pseudorhodoplanes sp.]